MRRRRDNGEMRYCCRSRVFFFFEIYDLEGAKKKMGERRVFVFY